jgi:hypothetical protein
MPITNLRLLDVTGSGHVGFTSRFTGGLELLNVHLKSEAGPALSIPQDLNRNVTQ